MPYTFQSFDCYINIWQGALKHIRVTNNNATLSLSIILSFDINGNVFPNIFYRTKLGTPQTETHQCVMELLFSLG